MADASTTQAHRTAAKAIASADALVIAAGAGMGVDSGLPDFRGREGFWRAYPVLKDRRLDFESIATPGWFDEDPELAWGFYGHRLALYRRTVPHEGFAILREVAADKPHGAFVVTSNVDGQFQRAGFTAERVLEVHGTIHHNQCSNRCGAGLFDPPADVPIDAERLKLTGPLPTCPRCGAVARPNILMFDDLDWDDRRTAGQWERFRDWLAGAKGASLAVVECGAGQAISTVRQVSERLVRSQGARLVRINPRDADVPPGQISIAEAALTALRAIGACLERR